MIFKRLKKSTKREEEEFAEMMDREQVGCKDRFAMLLSAFFVIMIPCIAILVGLGALMIWILGLL